jgi:hypothetical protein
MNTGDGIGLASLALGIWLAIRTRGIGALERRLRTLELARAERQERARRVADIRVYALIGAGQIVLENVGESPARQVDLTLTPDPIAVNERPVVFPIPNLLPGQAIPVVAGFASGCLPPLPGVLTYRDAAGPHRITLRVERAD